MIRFDMQQNQCKREMQINHLKDTCITLDQRFFESVKYNIDPNKGTGTIWIKKARHIASRAFLWFASKLVLQTAHPSMWLINK
jgi:hypothetical protein